MGRTSRAEIKTKYATKGILLFIPLRAKVKVSIHICKF